MQLCSTDINCNLKNICDIKKEPVIKYKDILSTIKITYKENGLLGFFRGMIPRTIQQAPSAAISWATYETLKNFLSK